MLARQFVISLLGSYLCFAASLWPRSYGVTDTSAAGVFLPGSPPDLSNHISSISSRDLLFSCPLSHFHFFFRPLRGLLYSINSSREPKCIFLRWTTLVVAALKRAVLSFSADQVALLLQVWPSNHRNTLRCWLQYP